ncbi:MAG: hypothetical protein K8R60_04490 [Burkholderiales bacterium]|nr:hypothetical protein [Burkholderiales bacterium]
MTTPKRLLPQRPGELVFRVGDLVDPEALLDALRPLLADHGVEPVSFVDAIVEPLALYRAHLRAREMEGTWEAVQAWLERLRKQPTTTWPALGDMPHRAEPAVWHAAHRAGFDWDLERVAVASGADPVRLAAALEEAAASVSPERRKASRAQRGQASSRRPSEQERDTLLAAMVGALAAVRSPKVRHDLAADLLVRCKVRAPDGGSIRRAAKRGR